MTAGSKSVLKAKPSETISRLQRGILRLALSFHGQNPDLDQRLKELGTLVRGGRKDDRLQQLIDEIVDIIVSQDITQNDDHLNGRALCELLGRLEAKIADPAPLKPIIKRLSLPLDREGFDAAVDEAADVVAGMTSAHSDAELSPCESVAVLIEKIEFPDEAAARVDELKERIRDRRNEIELIRNLESAAALISSEIAQRGDGNGICEAREQLLLLMNLIPFPAALQERSGQTRRGIEQATTAAALYGCIPEIAGLTGEMRLQLQKEVDELEEFLKSTLKRLQDFESQIRQTDKFHEQTLRNTLDLEKTLGDRASSMRADLDDETDITVIKTAVSSHLDAIDESLTEFVHVEDERNREARERINEMVVALNELEFEAKSLRDSLEKQHEQVLIDPLTGILNRTGYDENINKEFVRWRRYGSNLSLAVIDLDLFKDINDSYGHSVGDKVLTTVARQIEGQIRECDILCRYGGEEFVLLLPETTMDDGLALLEKLRSFIAECKFHFHDKPVPVTMSCGIASFRKNDTIESVFDRADQAMYHAKRCGRNQCCTEDALREETA